VAHNRSRDEVIGRNLYFTDGTNFSLDFTLNEPAIVPKIIEFGKYIDGDYVNLRTYLHRKDKFR
jgi:hypothetical protein